MLQINRFLLICISAIPASSYAALGGDVSSIAADNKVLSSSVSTIVKTPASDLSYTASTIKTSSNQTIIEYSRPDGKVFCVTWHGSSYPNFQQILGNDAPQLKTASKSGQGSTSSNNLVGDDFIFIQYGLPGHLSGKAYKQSLVPHNVDVNSLK